MAAVVGTLVGLAAVAFAKVSPGCRTNVWGHWYILLILSASVNRRFSLFGGAGDVRLFLVRKYAPEAGGSGIPEIEGRWKINVPFAGGVCCR